MRTKEIAHISWQLEMIQAHFALAILEESFDVPAREGDVEEGLQRDFGICVGEEVLRFTAEDFLFLLWPRGQGRANLPLSALRSDRATGSDPPGR